MSRGGNSVFGTGMQAVRNYLTYFHLASIDSLLDSIKFSLYCP